MQKSFENILISNHDKKKKNNFNQLEIEANFLKLIKNNISDG